MKNKIDVTVYIILLDHNFNSRILRVIYTYIYIYKYIIYYLYLCIN